MITSPTGDREIRETENALHRLGLPSAGMGYITVSLAAKAPGGALAYLPAAAPKPKRSEEKTQVGHSSRSSGFRRPFECLTARRGRELVLLGKAGHLICQRFVWKYNALLTLPPQRENITCTTPQSVKY